MTITTVTPELVKSVKSGTMINTTSGTEAAFTGIPSGVKRILVALKGVSTNGNTDKWLQIGDSGGYETTGYLGAGSRLSGAALSGPSSLTTGFNIGKDAGATMLIHGVITLVLMDAATNLWACSSILSSEDNAIIISSGTKALSGTLDRLRLISGAGTETFDAGSMNIQYEF
jgi:hypothetical protein